jgi:hypothetical protein
VALCRRRRPAAAGGQLVVIVVDGGGAGDASSPEPARSARQAWRCAGGAGRLLQAASWW